VQALGWGSAACPRHGRTTTPSAPQTERQYHWRHWSGCAGRGPAALRDAASPRAAGEPHQRPRQGGAEGGASALSITQNPQPLSHILLSPKA